MLCFFVRKYYVVGEAPRRRAFGERNHCLIQAFGARAERLARVGPGAGPAIDEAGRALAALAYAAIAALVWRFGSMSHRAREWMVVNWRSWHGTNTFGAQVRVRTVA